MPPAAEVAYREKIGGDTSAKHSCHQALTLVMQGDKGADVAAVQWLIQHMKAANMAIFSRTSTDQLKRPPLLIDMEAETVKTSR